VVKIVTPLVLWWLLMTAALIAITWVCRQVSDLGLAWAGIEVSRVLPLVALYFTVGIVGSFCSGVHLGGHQFLVTRMYAQQQDPSGWQLHGAALDGEAPSRRLARVAIFGTLGLLAAALGAGWFAVSRMALTADVGITAHRGASMHAPENTMAAFRAAMDAGATYIELDVQRTRDEQIVVLHDGDLLRIGGDPRKVSELMTHPISSRSTSGASTTPSLPASTRRRSKEVIELVRGKMKINVELKYNVPDPGGSRRRHRPAAARKISRRRDHFARLRRAAASRERWTARHLGSHGGRFAGLGRTPDPRQDGFPEPQCRQGNSVADPPRARRRQASACVDGQYPRGHAAHDRARRGQHHHRRPGAAGACDCPTQFIENMHHPSSGAIRACPSCLA
jgi:hypothetical protein